MVALEGYYDGEAVQVLGNFYARKNQKLIITVLDEFVEETPMEKKSQSARGALSQYANPALRVQEESAWEKAMVKKYGNA